MALRYHQGQIAVQTEANTRRVADMLASWVGPVGEFCGSADMIVLATPEASGRLGFLALSGAAPVVEVAGPASVLLRLDDGAAAEIQGSVSCGGLAISLAVARRARLNGTLTRTAEGLVLRTSEAFTNCRKYVMPSMALESSRHTGPTAREPARLDDARLREVLTRAETAFLATVSPEGIIDVSHRGGPAGFFEYDGAGGLCWDEYVGDGMLKSAGNVRATGRISVLAPDLTTGEAFELSGRAEVSLVERDKRPRTEGLLQHKDDFPVQGHMTCRIDTAYRLEAFMHPRRRIEKRQRITSASATSEQAPQ